MFYDYVSIIVFLKYRNKLKNTSKLYIIFRPNIDIITKLSYNMIILTIRLLFLYFYNYIVPK